MELVGFFAAGLIGISLGLIGAGGSILTVPMMVYLFHVPVLLATSYSLLIVGFTSLLGVAVKYKQGNVHTKTALSLALTSITVVSLVRRFVIPSIPRELFIIKGVWVESSTISMALFSLLMIVSSISMIIKRKEHTINVQAATVSNFPRLLLCGAIVGLVTGLLGAGGGFLLIPALVFFLGFPIKEAMGTSLLIIALNSLIGFVMDLSHFSMDWKFLGTIAAIAGVGIVVGIRMSKEISSDKLKITFGWFVMITGIAILFQELVSYVSNVNSRHVAGY